MFGVGVNRELLRRRELCLVASIHEIADDLEVFHVLPGGEFRCRRGHEASLSLNYVRRESAPADFLQAADQELEIDNRRYHSEETRAVFHGRTDQENGMRRLAFADYESLSVVNAAVTGRGIGTFQLPVQKGVGSDTPGRDSLGIGVEQRSVGYLVGGGYEIFQQRP